MIEKMIPATAAALGVVRLVFVRLSWRDISRPSRLHRGERTHPHLLLASSNFRRSLPREFFHHPADRVVWLNNVPTGKIRADLLKQAVRTGIVDVRPYQLPGVRFSVSSNKPQLLRGP